MKPRSKGAVTLIAILSCGVASALSLLKRGLAAKPGEDEGVYAIRWNLPFCPCSGRNITVHCNGTREHLNGSAPPWLSRVGEPAELPSGLNPAPNLLGGRVTATTVTTGTNNIQITAKVAAGNTTTHTWQVVATSGTNQTLTYDPDGNLLNDGTQTYEWDAANRLTAVNEPGNLRSEFTYDGLSRRVKIVEKSNGAVTSTKNLLWCGTEICEERDASNNVTRRYYPQGMQLSGSNYFYTRDHLGSVRELTDSSGVIQARYSYDPYGRRTKLSGALAANFGFTGDYWHVPSGLALTLYRAYNPDLGRWISRDPIGEDGGVNLYEYVSNNPTNGIDPLGLWQITLSGGWGLGGYLSFGHNSGQWNLSARAGIGAGFSAGWDRSDSGCRHSGWNPITITGSLGAGIVGGTGEVGVGPDGTYGSLGGRISALAGGVGVNVSTPTAAATFSTSSGLSNYGASGFAGTGYTATY